jgi:hypothetical protein
MALALNQLGVLYIEQGRPAEAVPLTLRSLVLYLKPKLQRAKAGEETSSGVLDVDTPMYTSLGWLSRQRRMLSEDAFRAIIAEHCDAESTRIVLAILDWFDRTQAPMADKRDPGPAADALEHPRVSKTWLGRVRKRLRL